MTAALFIVNPSSAGGRTGRRWVHEIQPLVSSRFGVDAECMLTEKPGDAVAMAASRTARRTEDGCRGGG